MFMWRRQKRTNPLQITKWNRYDSSRTQSYVHSIKTYQKMSLSSVCNRQAHTYVTWTLLCFLPQLHGLTLLQTLKCSPPVSIASMRASVSLLRMQSMRWRWVRSPALSKRRSPEAPLRSRGAMLDLGRALRPSKSRTSSRSTRRMVSRTHLLSWEDDSDSQIKETK